jgi:pectin methylesterase-like acyl-CoA thioesterase
VGSLHGITTPSATTFTTIQAAVDAAMPGDWILRSATPDS